MLHGDIEQKQRERIVGQFRQMRIQVIIATDVIARGLDIDHVSHVINYGLPKDSDCYIHRVGRTGRVGRSGVAITIINNRERNVLRNFERATRQEMMELKMPSSQEIYENRVQHYVGAIQSVSQSTDLSEFEDITTRLLAALPQEVLIKSLIQIVQKDRPLKVKLQAPRPVSKSNYSRDNKKFGTKRAAYGTREYGPKKEFGRRERDQGKYSYRVDLGRNQGVSPSDIFVSLVNNMGMDKKDVGRIRISDNYSILYTNKIIDISRYSSIKLLGKYHSLSSS